MKLFKKNTRRSPDRSIQPNKNVKSTQNYYRGRISSQSRQKPSKVSLKPVKESFGKDKKSKLVIMRNHIFSLSIVIIILGLLSVNATIGSAVFIELPRDNIYRSTDEYIQSANKILNDNWSFRTKLTFQSEEYEQKLKDEFPEIASVSAVLPIAGRELQLSMTLQKPIARLVVGGGRELVLTDAGRVVESNLSGNYPILSLQEPHELENGSQLLTSIESELLTLISQEFDGSSELRPKVKSTLYDIRRRELQVRFNDLAYYAKFTAEAEAGEQVGSLVATIADIVQSRIDKPKKYVDVRVAGRVFIK